MSTNPIIMIMVGLPGSGKSTYISTLLEYYTDYAVLSSDSLIEDYAKSIGKTYNEVFKDAIKQCEAQLRIMFQDAVASKRNIIIDQTNLTVKKRAYILSHVPKDYSKIVVYFDIGLDIVKERLKQREAETGKYIPWNVVQDMYSRLEVPTLEEGFDEMLLV